MWIRIEVLVAAILWCDGLRRMQQLVSHVIVRSLSPVESDEVYAKSMRRVLTSNAYAWSGL